MAYPRNPQNHTNSQGMILYPGERNPNTDPNNTYKTIPTSFEAWKLIKDPAVEPRSERSWDRTVAKPWSINSADLADLVKEYKRKGKNAEADKAKLKAETQRQQIDWLLAEKNRTDDPRARWTLVMVKDKREQINKTSWSYQTESKVVEVILKRSRAPQPVNIYGVDGIDSGKKTAGVIRDLRYPNMIVHGQHNGAHGHSQQHYNPPVQTLAPILHQSYPNHGQNSHGHDHYGQQQGHQRRNSSSGPRVHHDDDIVMVVDDGDRGRGHGQHQNQPYNRQHSNRRPPSANRHNQQHTQPYPQHQQYNHHGRQPSPYHNRNQHQYEDSSDGGSSQFSGPQLPDYSPPSSPGAGYNSPIGGFSHAGVDYMRQGYHGTRPHAQRGLPYPGYNDDPMAHIMPNRNVGRGSSAFLPGRAGAGAYPAGGRQGYQQQRRNTMGSAHFDHQGLANAFNGMNLGGGGGPGGLQ